MQQIKQNKLPAIIALLITSTLAFPTQAQAVCPVCTVAVGVGLGVSRWLGIDDLITGLWIGGLSTSMAFWMMDWVSKKDWSSDKTDWLFGISFHMLLIPSLYLLNIAGDPLNTFWGLDKIVLGIVIGSVVFISAVFLERKLKAMNNNQVFIYYQKVILPMLFLSITSFIFYLLKY